MTGYEQRVVNEWTDGAWREFQGRLADWMDPATDRGTGHVVLDVDVDELDGPCLAVRAQPDEVTIFLETYSEPDHRILELPARFRPSPAAARRLVDLGFVAGPDGAPELRGAPSEAERLAHAVVVVLRDLWGAVAPAFLTVEDLGHRPVDLVPASVGEDPGPADVPVPEVARADTREGLQRLVEAVVQERVDGSLGVSDDGWIRLRGRDDESVVIRACGTGLVEVFTVLATEVRFKTAHREADRLSRRYPFVRFFLDRDTLVAVAPVDAQPLVAEHLHATISHVLRLSGTLADLDVTLKRRRVRPASRPELDERLAAIASEADRLSTSGLADLLEHAAGSHRVVMEWIAVARTERERVEAVLRDGEADAVQLVLVHERRRWRIVGRALRVVRDRALDPTDDRSDR